MPSNHEKMYVDVVFGSDTAQAEAGIKRLQASLSKLQTKGAKNILGEEFGKDLTDASIQLSKFQGILKSSFNVNTNKLDLTKFNANLQAAGMSAKDIANTFSAFGTDGKKAFSDLTNTIMDAEIPLKKNNKLVEKFAETLKNTARWMIASNLLTSVLGTFQHAFSYAQDLNSSLNDIRIVTSKSKDEMEAFAVQANKAAKTLSTTTTEYTKASLIYFQQGLSDAEVKRRTDATVKMANVTGESVQQMSDELTSVWNNFMEAGDTNYEHYLDIMTKLGAETASSSEEISQGLQKFSGIAKTVGLSFEVASAALTTITDRTRQSADVVGTSLKTIFSRIEGLKLGETLEDGTDLNKYSEALATVGVQIKDEAGNLKDADEIIMDLGHKWKTLARDQQMALAQTVGGVRQYNQIMSLMSNFDFFEENLERARTASGTLDEQAEIYAESWDAAKKRISAAAEEIYDKLINDDFFIKLTDAGADILDFISNGIDMLGGVPGLLSTILALTTTLLNRSGVLSKTLQNTFAPSFAKQQQTGQAVQKSFLDESLALTKKGEISNEDTAINNALKARYGIQDTLLKNSKSMTDLELAQAKALQDQYNALLEISIQKAKNLDLAQEELNTVKKEIKERQTLINSAYNDATKTRGSENYRWANKDGEFNKENYIKSLRSGSKQITIGQTRAIMKAAGGELTLEDDGILRSITDVNNLSKDQEKILGKLQAAIARVTDAYKAQSQTSVKTLEELEAENKKYNDLITKLQRYKEEKAKNNEGVTSGEIKQLLGNEYNDQINIENIDKTIDSYEELKQKNIELAESTVSRLTKDEKLGKQAAKSLDEYTNTYRENADVTDLSTTATEQFGQAIVKLKSNVHSWADALSGTLQGMSQLAMSLTMLKGVWDTLQNPDMGPLEKITSITMTLGMALGSLVSSFKALSAAKVKDTTVNMLNAASEAAVAKAKRDTANASQQAALAQKVETTEQNKDNIVNGGSSLFKSLGNTLKLKSKSGQAAVQDVFKSVKIGDTVEGTIVTEENIGAIATKNGIANGSVLSGLASAAGPILGVVAALAALAAIIYTVWKTTQHTEDELKNAEAGLEAATSAAEAAKTAYDGLNSSIDQIKSKRDALDGLTKGTLEYKQALMESNQAVLDLINSNEDLTMSMLHGTAESGYYLYNSDLENAQNAALERATRAMASQSMAQARVNKAQNAQIIDDFLSSNWRWARSGNNGMGPNGTYDLVSDLNTDAQVKAMNELGDKLLETTSSQDQMVIAAQALGFDVKTATDLSKVLDTTEQKQIEALIENTKALNSKTDASNYEAYGEAYFSAEADALGLKGIDRSIFYQQKGAQVEKFQELYRGAIGNSISRGDANALVAQYFKELGIDGVSVTKSGGKFTVHDANGRAIAGYENLEQTGFINQLSEALALWSAKNNGQLVEDTVGAFNRQAVTKNDLDSATQDITGDTGIIAENTEGLEDLTTEGSAFVDQLVTKDQFKTFEDDQKVALTDIANFIMAEDTNVESANDLDDKTKKQLEIVFKLAHDGQDPANIAEAFEWLLEVMAEAKEQLGDSTLTSGTDSDSWSKNKKYLSDVQKRYHDINSTLQLMQNNYKKISTLAEHAFGKTRLSYLKMARQQLEETNKAEQHKLELTKQQLAIDRQALAQQVNARFNEYGQITNYDEITRNLVAEYNANLDNEAVKAGVEEKLKLIETYDESLMDVQDQEIRVLEIANEIKNQALEDIKLRVEVNVSLAEDSLKVIDYQLSKIQDNAFDGAKKIELLGDRMEQLTNSNDEYTNALKETLGLKDDEIAKLLSGDMSVLESKEYTTEQMEYMRQLIDNLIQSSESVRDVYKQIQETVIASFDAVTDNIEQDLKLLGEYKKSIENLNNIIDLAGKAHNKNYNNLKIMIADTVADFALSDIQGQEYQLAVLSGKLQQLKVARATATEEEIKALDEQIAKVETDIEAKKNDIQAGYTAYLEKTRETCEAIVKAAKDSYDEIVSGAFETVDEMGNYLQKYSEQRDVYLEGYEKEYELNKLLRNIDKQLSDSSQLKSNQRLLDLKQKISDAASSTAEMSKVELEMLQKQYDVEVARLALEETRNAKDRVTLVQGSEGNMYYAYSADLDKVDQATQNYEDALKAQKDSIFEWTEKLNSSLVSLMKIVKDNSGKYSKTYKDWAQKELNNLLRQRGDLDVALGSLSPQDAAQLGFGNSVLGQMFPDESFASLGMKWQTAFDNMSTTVNKAEDDWTKTVDEAMEKMGFSIESFEQDVTKAIQTIDEKHSDLMKKMEEKYGENGTLTKKVRKTVEAFEEWKKKWLGDNQNGPMYTMLKGNEAIITQSDKIFKAIAGSDKSVKQAFVDWGTAVHGVAEQLDSVLGKLRDIPNAMDEATGGKVKITDPKTGETIVELAAKDVSEERIQKALKKAGYKRSTVTKPSGQTSQAVTSYWDETTNEKITDFNNYTPKAGTSISVYGYEKATKPQTAKGAIAEGKAKMAEADAANKPTQLKWVKAENKYVVAKEEDPNNLGWMRVYIIDSYGNVIDANATEKRWIDKDLAWPDGKYNKKYIKHKMFLSADGASSFGYVLKPGTPVWANFDTGGYTGAWGPEGKLAMLHQKELVLNADDTKRMLLMTQIARSVAQQVDLTAKYGLSTAGLVPYRTGSSTTANNMEQTVTINAEFPGVTDSVEIKQALDNLMNTASHYANRK